MTSTNLSLITGLNILNLLNQSANSSSSSNSLNNLVSTVLGGNTLSSSSTSSQLSVNLSTIGLMTAASKLTDGNPLSVFSVSGISADTIVDAVTDFADKYNSAVDALSGSSSAISRQSADSIAAIASANAEALEAIGITIDDDGKMVINSEALQEVAENSPEDIQSVFNDTTFISTITAKAKSAISQVLGLSSGAGFMALYSSSVSSGVNSLLTSQLSDYL